MGVFKNKINAQKKFDGNFKIAGYFLKNKIKSECACQEKKH
jgi:hypothetical protein